MSKVKSLSAARKITIGTHLPDEPHFPVLKSALVFFVLAFVIAGCDHGPVPTASIQPGAAAPAAPALDSKRFAQIDEIARDEIASGHTPGAVILVGQGDSVLYRKAFGNLHVGPQQAAMTEDTIFDISSMTKVVATTTAIMQLADRGLLRIDDPVAKYWPEFAANGKGSITLGHLLTHFSGLRADVNPRVRWSGYDGALSAIARDKPVSPCGTSFRYSDANFVVLGEIVHRVSGLPLDVYCAREIFKPVSMHNTSFRPSKDLKPRIAPCDVEHGELRWGEVQDPTAYRMGQVAGNAGVFSTADDLSFFVRMLLDGGMSKGGRILSPQAIAAMTKPHSIPGSSTVHGLGWDILSPYSKQFTAFFPAGSFGHTGYTGTSIWIDPHTRTYLIVLTNRLYPDGKGDVKSLRARIAAAVSAVIPMGPPAQTAKPHDADASSPSSHRSDPSTGSGQANAEEKNDPRMTQISADRNINENNPRKSATSADEDKSDHLRLGIDVLASEAFAPLVGRKIGIITNHTGIDSRERSTLSLLRQAPGVKVCAIFSPEHGLAGNLDEKISSGKDASTGLPVYSLYGQAMRPTPEMLRGLDALVYDIQDVGTRFYTYITTMAYAMEAAAAAGIDFYVLDRPNPIGASIVQGPVLDRSLKSFIGYFPLPVRYGMTVGELAQLFNRENAIGAKLHVVRMEGYRRETCYDEAGLRWVNPSPNIRSVTEAFFYPGVALVESCNVSVGRGTDMPFEIVGAPWISGDSLAGYLNRRHIAGTRIEPVSFTPKAGPFANKRCEGVRLRLVDRTELDAPALGIELAAALYSLYPKYFQIDSSLGMIGDRNVLLAVKNGEDPRDIRQKWLPALNDFCRVRDRYLLY